MILEMYIGNLLIDRAEMDFRFCDTLVQRENQVRDMKAHLYRLNLDKPFISKQAPTFYLVEESRANEIIMEDNLTDNSLVGDLESELLIKRALNRLDHADS